MAHRFAFTAIFFLVFPALLTAQLNRAYVSVERGSDANPCNYANPCRTIGTAIGLLNSGGEVIVVDGGGFTPFTVDRAASLQVPTGIFAGVIAGSGTAIAVNASSSDAVVLRGVTLTGVGATYGVYANSVGSLSLENLVVHGFGQGIAFHPADGGELAVYDSVVRNCTHNGVYVSSTFGIVDATIDNLRVHRIRLQSFGSVGVSAGKGGHISIRNSVVSGSVFGFAASAGDGTASMSIESSMASGNDIGVGVSIGSTIYLSNSAVVGNDKAFNAVSGGVIYSRGNNTVARNTTPGSAISTFSPQ